jgi:hypothetical protein
MFLKLNSTLGGIMIGATCLDPRASSTEG